MALIDGKKIALEIKNEVKARTAAFIAKGGAQPGLSVVLAGGDPASQVYVANKERACAETGIASAVYRLPESVSREELLALIDRLNADPSVSGVLTQLPLPAHIDETAVLERISPEKDVDCFHPHNVGLLYIGRTRFSPCTPQGVIELLTRSGVSLAGKNCVVIGRSNIVGKPLAALLTQHNATVTICHSKTENLPQIARNADILTVAVGRPRFAGADFVKEGAVVIDVGIHRLESGKLCGDVDFEAVSPKASLITPVPGGVGPMTVATLMDNCLKAAEIQYKSREAGNISWAEINQLLEKNGVSEYYSLRDASKRRGVSDVSSARRILKLGLVLEAADEIYSAGFQALHDAKFKAPAGVNPWDKLKSDIKARFPELSDNSIRQIVARMDFLTR
jgi:methylenetetrahydrofolate dehydrogenase (NADP+)/methenyltetrahydrofolate cyclohydrolase